MLQAALRKCIMGLVVARQIEDPLNSHLRH